MPAKAAVPVKAAVPAKPVLAAAAAKKPAAATPTKMMDSEDEEEEDDDELGACARGMRRATPCCAHSSQLSAWADVACLMPDAADNEDVDDDDEDGDDDEEEDDDECAPALRCMACLMPCMHTQSACSLLTRALYAPLHKQP